MNPQLQAEIARRYALDFTGGWSQIVNGDECEIWQAATADRPVVVRISPAWRTEAELCWVHGLTRHCAASLPEVVAPLAAQDGSTLFLYDEKPVTILPFVEGETLNTENAVLRTAAARLLGQIHAAGRTWTGPRTRPPSRATQPQPLPPERYPPELVDPELDAWHESLSASPAAAVGPMHGDFYERNLLCHEDHIVGVIDWDECRVGPLMMETGWCVWEFCQDWETDVLIVSWAHSFLQAYMDAGGPLRDSDLAHVIPAIRWRLRDESVHDLARRERGEDWDPEYTEREMRAFQKLRGRVLD